MNTIIALDICFLPMCSNLFGCESHVIIWEFYDQSDASNNVSYAG